MKRLFALVMAVLLAIGIYRVALDREPLTLSGFVKICGSIDLDFSETVELMDTIENMSFDFGAINGINDFIRAVKNFFVDLGNMLYVPIALIIDIASFQLSLINFVYQLLGGVFA